MIKKNLAKIENMSEALTSIHGDVMELKKDDSVLTVENVELKKKVADLETSQWTRAIQPKMVFTSKQCDWKSYWKHKNKGSRNLQSSDYRCRE